MSPLDLDLFRALPNGETKPAKVKSPPTHQAGEWFVKGPIPGPWLSVAAALPGKSLHVAMALWFAAGLTKRRKVKLTRQFLERFSVKPDAGRRALQKLETASLVTVERGPGRCPTVTINDTEA